MTYIPSNKIITNLFTNGNEYQTIDGEAYAGPYWKKYTGEVFTGKTPNDLPSLPLTPLISNESISPFTETTSYSLLNVDDLGETSNNLIKPQLVEDYQSIKDINYEKLTVLLPSSFYPSPTEDDYTLGIFTRYFCVKINEPFYLEISEDTFKNLNEKHSNWSWQYFTPFKIQWTLTGSKKTVQQINYNISLLTEKRLKRKGLQQFLKYNYLKFYKA